MREDVACADSGLRFLPARQVAPIHYVASTPIEAFGEVRRVWEWAQFYGVCDKSLLRRLNALPDLPVEVVLEMPPCVRIAEGTYPGGPRSWTWDALPWEVDRWAQAWVAAHPHGASLEEIGDALGVTREAVRQMETRALRKISRSQGRARVRCQELLEGLREVREQRAQVAL